MKASEVMTRQVIAGAPDTPVKEVAKLMVDQRISAVPVMGCGKLVGITPKEYSGKQWYCAPLGFCGKRQ